MATGSLTLQLSGDDGLVETRERLRAWLGEAGAENGDRDDIVLACWEATANAIEHPLETEKTEVRVYAEERDGHILLCVSDNGRWHDRAATNVREGRGLGLTLIRALMDMVQVVTTSNGTSVLMCHCISSTCR